ncbi:YDG/SRA domain-containing protein [Deinococcus arcticus]|uniref:HNH endonuclease n=1 Tax=Deinococcus arcticus TaxID=2136176 RepID=A0A2T3W4S2_9DEIO|nr:YDG/SRA domain-containing protein [Deinococcus arcticus]PTA66890.1 HNH endonuclease [Deinococcus arcticus]
MTPPVGEVPGIAPGTSFEGRRALSEAGVHRPLQAGIAGTALGGAVSVVLSGGYEDDQDSGEQILYTGEGGRDPRTGAQTAHQLLTRGNLALARSHLLGQPVRVVRRVVGSTYRYDGLYWVTSFWHEVGRSGYRIWRFLLEAQVPSRPERQATTRLSRTSAHAAQVKAWHDHTCQLCGLRLSTPAGPYAEAAHIRPLGQPHCGPDTPENLLCLCPNCHVLFDLGGVGVAHDLSLLGRPGALRTARAHHLDPTQLAYHRAHVYSEEP